MRARRTLLIALAAVMAAHLADLGSRASAVEGFTSSPGGELAGVLAYEPSGANCEIAGDGDMDALARALITVESLATPAAERLLKAGIVKTYSRLGAGAPDLTYGPGRVRLSTAAHALRRFTSSSDLAARLLDYCETKRIVAAILANLIFDRARPAGPIDLDQVRKAARMYNGQAEAHTPDALVAHETYTALVYALFQQYRFDRLQDD